MIERIRRKLGERMVLRDLSFRQVEKQSGVNYVAVYRFLREHKGISSNNLEKLNNYLNK